MELISLIFLAGFAAAAWFDYTRRMLPDALTAVLWGVCFFLPAYLHGWLIGLFALSLLVNSLPKKPMFGWGDILLFPAWFGAIWNVGFVVPAALLGLCASVALVKLATGSIERFPVALFFALSFIVALVIAAF